MRRIVPRLALVVLVLAVCAASVYPPQSNLRLGKDLSGGVSLVYSVQLGANESPEIVIPKIIDVLKNRVDPDGQSDVAMVRQGHDRIEITMPLPTARVKQLKAEYEAKLAKLAHGRVDPSALEVLMREPQERRQGEIARLGGGDAERESRLRTAAEASDAAHALRARLASARFELKSAQDSGATPERIGELTRAVDDLEARTAQAELAYDQARRAVLQSIPQPDELRRVLELSRKSRSLVDTGTGKVVQLPSPRQAALDRLRERYPGAVALIDEIEAAHAAYLKERRALDDPSDLKRLLAGAGVLDFRITVNPGSLSNEQELRRLLHERGPRTAVSDEARWFKINRIDGWYENLGQLQTLLANPSRYFLNQGYVVEDYDGEYYILCYTTEGSRLTRAEGDWAVEGAYEGKDELGRPAINFQMDPAGALKLAALTGRHINERMAILLDDQVYTAPSLRGKIGKSGQITGDFSTAERKYIIRTLAAGSLQAKLSPEPISESTLGPNLGLDNLRKGLYAGGVALAVISGFMIVYYFQCGAIAVFALLCNALMLVGVMALSRAAFTLPGIAGVILTFGMAVDANVLIYERMREEFERGADMRTAVRLGYGRAMSSIVDGNVTNLIVCVVLYFVGSSEIRGFAITLGVGVVTTLFSALVISRLIFDIFVERIRWKRTSMLPMAVPVIARALHPRVNWLRFRYFFWGLSACYVGLGLSMVFVQGREMLDTEFRGGTQVELQFKERDPGGDRVTLKRSDVVDRVNGIVRGLPEGSPLRDLRNALILPVNPRADGVTSDRFMVKTIVTDKEAVNEALVHAFADFVDVKPPLAFDGSGAEDVRRAPVYPVLSGNLGDDTDRPAYRNDVRDFIGGAAIILEHLDPPTDIEALRSRLDLMREQPEYADTLGRPRDVRVLASDAGGAVTAAVVLVRDPNLSRFDGEDRWNADVAEREWRLTRDALSRATTLASVQSYSPSIAATFQAQAVVAVVMSFLLIGIYIWVRFGTMAYSVAAIVPLLHDFLTAVGFVAVAELLYDWAPTSGLMRSLGIMPFKIDLNMVAAFLTIIGYSLNDSIIVMDRIRENRGKLPYANAEAINSAVNQTVSRTIITSGTTLLSTIVLYLYGGEGVRGFAYALTIGILTGTYSSIAITAPFVWSRRAMTEHLPDAAPQPAG
jgi:SecD/SecF fusion protein